MKCMMQLKKPAMDHYNIIIDKVGESDESIYLCPDFFLSLSTNFRRSALCALYADFSAHQ